MKTLDEHNIEVTLLTLFKKKTYINVLVNLLITLCFQSLRLIHVLSSVQKKYETTLLDLHFILNSSC